LTQRQLGNHFAHFLMWDVAKGYGRLTSSGTLKNDYWDHYEELRDREETELLYKIRHKVCEDYAPHLPILDFGIGNGEFIKRKPKSSILFGYDIDEDSVCWLKAQNLWLNFWTHVIPRVVTFWDSLEHLDEIDAVIERCPQFIICSLPVFESREEVLESKHFKPNEHVWYFSVSGLMDFMEERGFECLMTEDLEQLIGREGIQTFVFERSWNLKVS